MAEPGKKNSLSIKASLDVRDGFSRLDARPAYVDKLNCSMLLVFIDRPVYKTGVFRCAKRFGGETDRLLRAIAVDDDIAADGLTGNDLRSGSCHD